MANASLLPLLRKRDNRYYPFDSQNILFERKRFVDSVLFFISNGMNLDGGRSKVSLVEGGKGRVRYCFRR